MDRYERLLELSTFSKEKLELLQSKNVLVIGAGGVGQHISAYLITNGVTRITLVDFDKVEGAKEYQITYSTNKKFTKKTTKTVKVKKNTGSVKNVNKGKTYYTKVRALVEIDGKIYYGPYTKANKIK